MTSTVPIGTRLRALLLALLSLVLAAPPLLRAAGEASTPDALLRTAVDEVITLVYDTPAPADGLPMSARARPVLAKYFSFELTTSRAIGPGWRQFTPEQKEKTTHLFTEMVLRTYADKFTPGEKPKIAFGKTVSTAANRSEVPTTLTYAGSTYAVNYRLENTPAGWKIYDVIIEGVSMIANYRSQFDALFQKGGAAEIIRTLEGKVAAASAPAPAS